MGGTAAASPAAATQLAPAGLYVLLSGLLLPLIDFSIVNVALDALSRSLGASPTELELMVAVYGISFAVCLAMGGRLGDNHGRRRVFAWGVGLFGLASLLCGVAGSMGLLLVARVLQGAAAALIVPQILSTIHVGLKGQAHSRALGFYGAVGGLAFIIGQVLGGLLVSSDLWGMGWRSVFLINLPICVAVLACTRRWVPETRREQAVDIDWPGTVWLALLIVCLLLPLALGPIVGWSWPCWVPLAAALPIAAQLWRVEHRQARSGRHPLLPPALLKLHSVRFGLLIAVLFFTCWSGFMFVMALALQAGAGLTPLQAGNAFIVLGLSYFVSSLISARVARRLGHVQTMLLGCGVVLAGLLLLVWTLHAVWPHPGAFNLAAATAVMGWGQALIVGSFWRLGLSDVPADGAGAGGAMLSTVQQAALGMGSALLGAIFAHALRGGQSYLEATVTALWVEFAVIAVLAMCVLAYHLQLRRHR
ncbi:putative MFS family arabinose efflux permease [Comamonas sp. BIGb0124]|nr:putative MFS family arabinose efflux permease [Comamonas sp. BIGb0124]